MGVFFVTNIFFGENQSFVRYSSQYIEIVCLQHKTGDKSVAFAYNLGLEYLIIFVNKYVVHNFWLLPVNSEYIGYTCYVV